MENNFHPSTVFGISELSVSWIDALYQKWRYRPDTVPVEWQNFFAGFIFAYDSNITHVDNTCDNNTLQPKISSIQSLINSYRSIGHLLACTDPLSPCMLEHPLLSLSNFALTSNDLDSIFSIEQFTSSQSTLREIVSMLKDTYCRDIGVEFMHIQDPTERQWLIDQMESCRNHPVVNYETQIHLIEKLNEATLFESFLQRRFPGQKRFSLEGSEILIPVLDAIVRSCPSGGISDIILGMAHRGRLNVLAHILGKPYENIFAEFKDAMSTGFIGDGDVKYHKGFSSNLSLPDGAVHVSIMSNPSHLEAVNTVVEGKCRARQQHYGTSGSLQVLPLLIHGDGAFAGQGIVMEMLNMSRLEGFSTGGTIHIVLNNQIGFTTSPHDSRSSYYATDVAKMLACPVFHVQGESPETALHVIKLALDYRQRYGRDVVIELVCYRRHGHNEGDDPVFTQPSMYRQIQARLPVNQVYAHTLVESGVSPTVLEEIKQSIVSRLDNSYNAPPQDKSIGFHEGWSSISSNYSIAPVDTSLSAETLLLLARRLAELPPGFSPHHKIQTLIQKRFEAVLKKEGIDWGNAEILAYASLLNEGISVRLSGQDSRRGTFNHRHCVYHDSNDGSNYIPLSSVTASNASFQVWDSPLSEFGVLGFEYGYSIESPFDLTIWEAQFGDFANGAQVIIDQFITSGETKWNRASGLVLFLPHGYEGQGAEHSSARLERFLQLCSLENMVVANPTSPAQIFHLLRRQMKQTFRKPLIVFTPKSLLRHPACNSTVDDLCNGAFYEVIGINSEGHFVNRILICSGKIFYELQEERNTREAHDVVLLRIEQIYPLRIDLIQDELSRYAPGVRCFWVQEEPENMGAWAFIRPKLTELCGVINFIGRPADSCPAVASHSLHKQQQAEIIRRAFET